MSSNEMPKEIHGVPIEEFEQASINLSTRDTGNYIVQLKNNTLKSGHGPCHYGISQMGPYNGPTVGMKSVLTKPCRSMKEEYRFYYHWLVTESHWAPAALVKDIDWVMQYGVIADCTSVPSGLTQGLNILARSPGERWEPQWSVWEEAVKNYNWDPHLALVLIHGVRKDYKDLLYQYEWSSHCVISGWYQSGEDVKRFIEGEIRNPNARTMEEIGYWEHVESLFKESVYYEKEDKGERNEVDDTNNEFDRPKEIWRKIIEYTSPSTQTTKTKTPFKVPKGFFQNTSKASLKAVLEKPEEFYKVVTS